MKLENHPERELYRRHRTRARQIRETVRNLDAHTRGEAVALLERLTALLQSYNRVLWQHFPYCGQCLGGCCVVGATDLKLLDYAALALLDEKLPVVPAYTGRDARACIYLTPRGCSWPERWRPLKCALFYCLGSGAITVDASDARYGEITAALEEAIGGELIRLLPDAAEELLPLLPDPVAFAEMLAQAIIVHLPDSLYEEQTSEENVPQTADAADETLAFVAQATELLLADPPTWPPGNHRIDNQFLADLETLAWIAEGQPGHAARLLAEMSGRYPPATATSPSLYQQMAVQIEQLSAKLGRDGQSTK